MPITRAELVDAFVQSGATRSGGVVSIPESQCIALGLRIRALATDVQPTVPNQDVDDYLKEGGKLGELAANSPHPLVRGLARRLIALGG